MNLQDALDQFSQLADEDVIFARRPWTLYYAEHDAYPDWLYDD